MKLTLLVNVAQNDIPDTSKNRNTKRSTSYVFRSPGGTPLHKRKPRADPRDPASIIAEALKKKFAKQMETSWQESPGIV